ncbi:MAG TPA: aminoacyl-tRNA hydrolase [Candidatus Paceibacterota bacterium]
MRIDAIRLSMSYIILGLGNPGEEYQSTRHNSGALILDAFAKKISAGEWKKDNNRQSLVAKGELKNEKILLVKPQAFMNKSGVAVKDMAGQKKKLENLVVIHDDLDLPIGSMKIVFNRGSGGHKGVESVIRAVKSEAFTRIRIGICPTLPSGKLKKPDHKKLMDFIVEDFKKPEQDAFKKVSKRACEALEVLITESRQKAMTEYN